MFFYHLISFYKFFVLKHYKFKIFYFQMRFCIYQTSFLSVILNSSIILYVEYIINFTFNLHLITTMLYINVTKMIIYYNIENHAANQIQIASTKITKECLKDGTFFKYFEE